MVLFQWPGDCARTIEATYTVLYYTKITEVNFSIFVLCSFCCVIILMCYCVIVLCYYILYL